jgi:predicted dehydrogenase
MARIGIVGFGFMGKMHLNNLTKIEEAQVTAICDIDPEKLSGKASVAGNIAGTEDAIDLSGMELFEDAEALFDSGKCDAVSIALPTYLHKQYTVKALEAGLHVLCEKPMALNSADCQSMCDAAAASGKILQVGHCIRFWPEYAATKQLIDSGEYGQVKAAAFRRLSCTPTWAWEGWLMDEQRSGGAIHDLHIHDADYVQYLFGEPKAVFATAATDPKRGGDHVMAQYIYEDGPIVTAEGGWIMTDSFGFEMSFDIVLEKATICYNSAREPAFKVCPVDGDTFTPALPERDGYFHELAHFVAAISGEKVPVILTPKQSLLSVRIIEMEKESVKSGTVVEL